MALPKVQYVLRRRGIIPRLAAIALAHALFCAPATAAGPNDEDICLGKVMDVGMTLAACTRAVQRTDLPDAKRESLLAAKGYLLVASKRGYDDAIAALDEALKLKPDDSFALITRSVAHRSKGEFDLAIRDVDEYIRLNPKSANAFAERGFTWRQKGEFARAVADYDASLRIGGKFSAPILNDFAWILATAPDPGIRDGKRAVELAESACEQSEYKYPAALDTLAAAYAEAGNFPKAVEMEQRALEGDTYTGTRREGALARLELYRQGKPYRQPRP